MRILGGFCEGGLVLFLGKQKFWPLVCVESHVRDHGMRGFFII